MSNKPEIAKILTFLAALYPRYELTTTTIKAYCVVLEDIPPDLLQAAAQDLGGRSTFFPSASELRQTAFSLVELSEGVPSAGDAWGIVAKLSTGRPVPDDLHPLIKKSMDDIGGLAMLRQSNIDQTASHRARFIDAYKANKERQRRYTRMLPAVREQVGLPAGDIKQLAAKLSMNGND